MKYLIMKVKRSYAIALTEDDTFYVVANRNYQVGQYVVDPIIMKEYVEKTERSVFSLYKKGLALGLGLATAFVMVFGYGSYLDTVVGSYVIHADSIVEIAVNRSGLVDGIVAKNVQGERLLEGYDFNNKTKEVVTRELIERARKFGYINNQLDISVNSDSKYYQQLKDELYKIIIDFEDDDFDFEINFKEDCDGDDEIDDVNDDYDIDEEDDDIDEDEIENDSSHEDDDDETLCESDDEDDEDEDEDGDYFDNDEDDDEEEKSELFEDSTNNL